MIIKYAFKITLTEILYNNVAFTAAIGSRGPVVRYLKKNLDVWISGECTAETHVTLPCRRK